MKFVILIVGMAIAAWLVSTQLTTPKTTIPGGPSGTPHEILDQTRERLEASSKVEQKHADQAAAPQGAPPIAVPADP